MYTLDDFLAHTPSPNLERLNWSLACDAGVEVDVLRLDQIHSGWSGNKWYKLFGHVSSMVSTAASSQSGATPLSLVSCGGAYSNHLHALACLGQTLGIPTLGIVRGIYPQLTPTLQDCQNWGMRLLFSSRAQWRLKGAPDDFLAAFPDLPERSSLHWIPEGGGGDQGVAGCRLIAQSLIRSMPPQCRRTHTPIPIYLACGTGTTAAGIIDGLNEAFCVEGISVLKGEDQLTGHIAAQLKRRVSWVTPHERGRCSWQVHTEFHGGGYGKVPAELKTFALHFERETHLPLDPIYTLKVFWALSSHLQQGRWPRGTRVVVIHTGGLQGRRGMEWMPDMPPNT